MPVTRANGVRLAWERIGDPAAPALVLVMGYGMQLTAWPAGFCRDLAAGGFQVIRFDNRDIGLSERLHGLGQPPIPTLLARRLLGLPVAAPYTLFDMAQDTVALLDALAIDRAHVVGVSMGGMIAQRVAIQAPERVASLTSISSATGALRFALPRPRVMALTLTAPGGDDLGQRLRHGVKFWRAVASPGDPPSDAELEADLRAWHERSADLSGRQRQLAAIIAERSRVPALRRLAVPTLVIHGRADPMLPFAGGVATARAVPGARLLAFDGLGHDLRPRYLTAMARAILQHARDADGPR